MIDAIHGLGHSHCMAFLERCGADHGIGGFGQAAFDDIVHFEQKLAEIGHNGVERLEGAERTPGPAEAPVDTKVAQADPWVVEDTGTQSVNPDEAVRGFSERIFDGVTEVREAIDVIRENMNGGLRIDSMEDMLVFSTQLMGASVVMHMATSEVSGLVGKLDSLLKSG